MDQQVALAKLLAIRKRKFFRIIVEIAGKDDCNREGNKEYYEEIPGDYSVEELKDMEQDQDKKEDQDFWRKEPDGNVDEEVEQIINKLNNQKKPDKPKPDEEVEPDQEEKKEVEIVVDEVVIVDPVLEEDDQEKNELNDAYVVDNGGYTFPVNVVMIKDSSGEKVKQLIMGSYLYCKSFIARWLLEFGNKEELEQKREKIYIEPEEDEEVVEE
jgi:hypothetical protein